MWIYEKRLEYPVRITKPDPRMAKLLMAQYGGPDSELGAGLRYLTQRYSMPDDRVRVLGMRVKIQLQLDTGEARFGDLREKRLLRTFFHRQTSPRAQVG